MADRKPRFFLADHGEHYGMDLTDGRIYAAPGSREEQTVAGMHPGDRVFSLSDRGLSALGIAAGEPCRTPAPAWRYQYAKPGERGLSLRLKPLFLAVPLSRETLEKILPIPTRKEAAEPGIRLIPVGQDEAERILTALLEQNPELSDRIAVSSAPDA